MISLLLVSGLLGIEAISHSFAGTQVFCDPIAKEPIQQLRRLTKYLNKTNDLKLDESKIRPWDQEKFAREVKCKEPFKVTYEKDGKQLVFVAFSHPSGPVDPQNSDLKFLKQLLEDPNRPEGLMLETYLPKDAQPNSADQTRNSCFKNGLFTCGESAYASMLAMQGQIKVYGGEPGLDELNEAADRGLSDDELMAYRSTQAFLTLKRRSIPESQWPVEFKKEMDRNAKLKDKWSFEEFQSWYLKHVSSKVDFPNLSTHDVSDWLEPKKGLKAGKLQKISFKFNSYREPMIVQKAEEMLNCHSRSMIIYGSAHYYTQAPVYEKAFGKPAIECLNGEKTPTQ